MAGPLVLGTDPDNGADLSLTVFDKGGAWHTFIVAATGGGKTTLYNNIAEQATGCADMLVWAIDSRKGTIPYFWAPPLDASAGLPPRRHPRVRQGPDPMEWAGLIVRLRSAANGGRNHIPSPADPAILILIDEGDTLTGADSPIAHKAKPLVQDIFRGGRSAGTGRERGALPAAPAPGAGNPGRTAHRVPPSCTSPVHCCRSFRHDGWLCETLRRILDICAGLPSLLFWAFEESLCSMLTLPSARCAGAMVTWRWRTWA